MMMYWAWKISSDSEDGDDSSQNLLDKNIEKTCDTLLIEDTFVNSDTSIYNPDIHLDECWTLP